MKKLSYILLAAACACGTVACTVDELSPIETPVRTVRTFTCGFDEDATKTTINRQGKTLWAEGDKILLTNGTESDTISVAANYAGQKYCEFETSLEGKLYAVYPYDVLDSVTVAGNIVVNVASAQNGTFGSANIACAACEDRYVKLKNITSVLKFKIPAVTEAPVVFASVNAVEGAVSGPVSVSFADGAPVLTPIEGMSYSSSVSVKIDGGVGDFYVSVLPGSYKAGFGLTIATLDLAHAYESRTTAADKTLAVNELYDLGSIGAKLNPMGGNGTAEDPYKITSLGEMTVLAYYVNEGNTLKDKHVKLMNDVAGVSVPVGVYDAKDSKNVIVKPFQGEFDGNGKTITLDINQVDGRGTGLFAALRDSANVHDLKLAGSVVAKSSDCVGALVGNAYSASTLTIKNVASSANVSARGYVGGIAGLASTENNANFLSIDGCTNSGTVTGSGTYVGGVAGSAQYLILNACGNSGNVSGLYAVGGVAGHALQSTLTALTNSGTVVSTQSAGKFLSVSSGKITCEYMAASGGIAGHAQGVNIVGCQNSGTITGVNKTGGISGMLYWGTVDKCTNTGAVSVTEDAAGGIVGWAITQGLIKNCVNRGAVTTKRYQAGGIAGQVQPFDSQNRTLIIQILKCTNEGDVLVTDGNAAGGIVGYTWVMNNVSRLDVNGCTNKGAVKAPQYVGGIVGCYGRYSNWSRLNILNCENSGKIEVTKNIAGGIFGGAMNYTKSQGVFVENCLNTGEIVYNPENTTPYAGGIAGQINNGVNGWLKNCYNGGKIHPAAAADGSAQEAADDAKIGAIIGYNAAAEGGVVNMFYLDSTCKTFTSPNSKKFGTQKSVATVDAEGNLSEPITVGDVSYSRVEEALAAYANTVATYFKWTAGPKFSFTDPINIDGKLDLGNGGNL